MSLVDSVAATESQAVADCLVEQWRTIPGSDGYYSVSSLGRVRSEPILTSRTGRQRGRILVANRDNKGYPQFQMCLPTRHTTMKVHRAVALAFLGPRPDGYQINHKNGIKTDNRVANLEYVTCHENIRHCWEHGLHDATHCEGENNCRAKLTRDDVLVIRQLYPSLSARRLAALYGVSVTNICFIVQRKTWKHI